MWKSNALYLSLEGATGLFLTVVRVPWSLSPNQLRVTVQPSSGAEWGDLCKIVPLQLGKESGQGGSSSSPFPKPSMPLLPNSVSQCCLSLLGQGEGHIQKNLS